MTRFRHDADSGPSPLATPCTSFAIEIVAATRQVVPKLFQIARNQVQHFFVTKLFVSVPICRLILLLVDIEQGLVLGVHLCDQFFAVDFHVMQQPDGTTPLREELRYKFSKIFNLRQDLLLLAAPERGHAFPVDRSSQDASIFLILI